MNSIAVIPARMAASRFPNKPLKSILGIPMLAHCYYRAAIALGGENVYVATCDKEIADFIKGIGGKAIMTSVNHNRATTRTSEAVSIIESTQNINIDIVIMIQGDEPLILPKTLKNILFPFQEKSINIVNIVSRFGDEDSFLDKNNVKVVVDKDFNALYFSREPIPSPWKGINLDLCFMQTGIIAFRRETLIDFNLKSETNLEKIESIDMNRVLEYGGKIRTVLAENITVGVDVPSDIDKVEKYFSSDKIIELYSSNYREIN